MAIDWTKLWAAADDGTVVGGTDLRTIQDDIDAGFEEALSDALSVALPSQPGNANKSLTTDGSDISWGWEVLDEDDMASNSDSSVSTQQAIVAYVTAQIGAISLTTEVESGTFTRDLTAAAGSVEYAGVTSFTPKLLLLIGNKSSTTGNTIGFSTGSSKNYCLYVNDANINTWAATNSSMAILYTTTSTNQRASLTSFDATGFTLTWTKTGSPTGTGTFIWIAIG